MTFANLGMSPIANDFVAADKSQAAEPFYPLHAYVCEECMLVQLVDFERADKIFTDDYAYFSSFSDSWLAHAKYYAEKTIAAEKLGPSSLVMEVASNDGYLLQYFKQAGVKVLGVEPTANTARAALEKHGIKSEVAFFGVETAKRLVASGIRADVTAANNVLAHVPDINDFVAGFKIVLKPGGLSNFEFPHLLTQIRFRQFDTIYHEHFSYLSLGVVRKIFASHGMRVYDVEELSTHGGSLRLFVCHDEDEARPDTRRIAAFLSREDAAGLNDIATYRKFSDSIIETKCDLLEFLIRAKRQGKRVAAYGAPAKGNTLLNYCGVKEDLIEFTVDRSPQKIGKLLPGVRIPILAPSEIERRRPDYLVILPWNLKDEIMEQMKAVRSWGCKFVIPIPAVQVFE